MPRTDAEEWSGSGAQPWEVDPLVRAVFFDLDGTLLRLDREYREVLAEAFTAVEGEARPEWLETYDRAFFECFSDCEPDPHRRAFERVEGVDDPQGLAAALRDREVEACRVSDGVPSALSRLSERFALGVLTNGTPERQRHKLAAFDLERYFDAVVTSYEAGAHKPAAAPYRLAERRLPAEAYLLVGDGDDDVDGARDRGWAWRRYDGGGFDGLVAALADFDR